MAERFLAEPALKSKLVELNEGTEYGYAIEAQKLVAETSYGKEPGLSYVRRVITAHQICPMKMALALVRVAEEEPQMPYEDALAVLREGKWFRKVD